MKLSRMKCTIEHYSLVRSKVLQELQNREKVLDLQDLERFDSSCIALILACRRRYPDCVVLNTPKRFERLVKLYGVQDIIFDKASK